MNDGLIISLGMFKGLSVICPAWDFIVHSSLSLVVRLQKANEEAALMRE